MKPDEVQKVLAWLRDHYVRCPNCAAKGGDVADMLALPMLEQPEPHAHLAASVLPVTCKKCGLVSLFNVRTIFGS